MRSKEAERSKGSTGHWCSQSPVLWKWEWTLLTAQELNETLLFPGDSELKNGQYSLFLGRFQYAVWVMLANWRRQFLPYFQLFQYCTEPRSMAAAQLRPGINISKSNKLGWYFLGNPVLFHTLPAINICLGASCFKWKPKSVKDPLFMFLTVYNFHKLYFSISIARLWASTP